MHEGVVLRRTKGAGLTYRACGNHTHCFHRVECVGERLLDDGSIQHRECFEEHPCRDHSSKMPRCHIEVPCDQAAPDGATLLSPVNVPSPTMPEKSIDAKLTPCGDAGIKLQRAARGFQLKRAWGPGIMYKPCSMGNDNCIMSVDCDGSQSPSSPLEDGGGLLRDGAGWPRCLEKEDCKSTPTSLECLQEVECEDSDDAGITYPDPRMHPTHDSQPQRQQQQQQQQQAASETHTASDLPLAHDSASPHAPSSPTDSGPGLHQQVLPMPCDQGAVQLSRAASGFWFTPARGGIRLAPCRAGGNALCVQILPCQSDGDNMTCLQRVPCDGGGSEICLTTSPCPM